MAMGNVVRLGVANKRAAWDAEWTRTGNGARQQVADVYMPIARLRLV